MPNETQTQYECSYCGQTFKSRGALTMHNRWNHQKGKPAVDSDPLKRRQDRRESLRQEIAELEAKLAEVEALRKYLAFLRQDLREVEKSIRTLEAG